MAAHRYSRSDSMESASLSLVRSGSDDDSIPAHPFSTTANPYLACVEDARLRLSLMPKDPRQVSFAIKTGITFDEFLSDDDSCGSSVAGSRRSSRNVIDGHWVEIGALAHVFAEEPSGGLRAPCVLDAPEINEPRFQVIDDTIHPSDIGPAYHHMPQAIPANRRPTPLDMDRITSGPDSGGVSSPTLAELCQATSNGPVKTPTFDTILAADRIASHLIYPKHGEDTMKRKSLGNKSLAPALQCENTSSYSSSTGHIFALLNADDTASTPRRPLVKQPRRPRPLPGLPENPRDTQGGIFLPGKAYKPKIAPEPYYPERFKLYDAGVKDMGPDVMFDNKWQLSGSIDAAETVRRRAVLKPERYEQEENVENAKLMRGADLKEWDAKQAGLKAGLKAAKVGEVTGPTFSRMLGDAGSESVGRKKKRMDIFGLFR